MCGDRSRCRRTWFRHLAEISQSQRLGQVGDWNEFETALWNRWVVLRCFRETMKNPYPWRSVTNVSEDDSFAEFCARLCAVMTNGWQGMLWRCHAETSLCFTTYHNHPQSTSNLHHTVCLIRSFETIQWDNEAMPAILADSQVDALQDGQAVLWTAVRWRVRGASTLIRSDAGHEKKGSKKMIQQKWSQEMIEMIYDDQMIRWSICVGCVRLVWDGIG